jgi:hypothetical protein
MTDEDDLRNVSRDLPAIDLDPAAAERIARAARRGPPRRRVIELVIVAGLVTGTLIWTVMKLVEAFSGK